MPADHPGNVLRLERRFAGPLDLVFAVWTEPRMIMRWFAAGMGVQPQECTVDLRPGGSWQIVNEGSGRKEMIGGVYHEVEPNRRLCYSYHFQGTEFFSIISVDLAEIGDGVLVKLCQTGFPDAQSFKDHGKGWPLGLQVMIDGLLLAIKADRVWPGMDERARNGVAADLAEARRRIEEQRRRPG
jgi:uncharacterized protein YndB with AHSA1/START domain